MSEPCKEAVSEARTFCDKFFDTLGLKKDGRDNHIYESMLSSFADIIQRAMEERDKRLGSEKDRRIRELEHWIIEYGVDSDYDCSYCGGRDGEKPPMRCMPPCLRGQIIADRERSNAERQSAVVTRSSEVDSQS